METALQRIEEGILKYAEVAFWDRIAIKEKLPIVDWVSSTVDLHFDLTSNASGKIRLYPYQIEPLKATEEKGCREVTLQWGQRLGKSTIWKLSMLKRMFDGGLSGLIVYPSMDMAIKTNRDTVLPLLRTLPNLRADLAAIGGRRKDSYHLPSARSVLYFIGGGAQVVSYTANWGVLDECDFIKLEKSDAEGENVDQLRALRLRMQTFQDRMLIACSSPTTYGGAIHQNYLKGSRGVWHLRCLKCGALSSASQLSFKLSTGGYAGLQWEKDESGNLLPDSIRWICPHCGHAHTYEDAKAMNDAGCYIHENPANLSHRSFQAGALANPEIWEWRSIAEAQEAATDASGRKFLANTILGKPYKHTREGDTSISIPDVLAGKMVEYPKDLGDRISLVCAGIDQQSSALAGSKYYVYAVRGWEEDGSSWLLSSGIAQNTAELSSIVTASYHGLPVSLALLDAGGFGDNAATTDPLVRQHPNLLYYKGGDDRTLSLRGKPWKPSETQRSLLLCNALHYQVKLLDLLYGPPRPSGYQWHIPQKLPAGYLEQVGAMQPNNRMRGGNGEAFANWTPSSVRHDFFDAEKMAIAAMEISCRLIPATHFRRGKIPLFMRVELLRALAVAGIKPKK